MDTYTILFYVFAALAVGSGFVVVFARNIIRAAFSLMFTFLGVAGLYVLLQADFIAVAQVMVYVGGILILLIFGVMLTRRVTSVEMPASMFQGLPSTTVVGVLAGLLILLVTRTPWPMSDTHPASPQIPGTTEALGEYLMSQFILPFEVAGLVLLVTIMGAAMIARDPQKKESL